VKTKQLELFPDDSGEPSEDLKFEDVVADYIVARRFHEEIDAKKKKAYKAYKAAESKLVDAMLDNGELSRKFETGITLSLKKFVDFKANEANTQEVLEWLEEQGEVADDYVGKSIKKVRLREFLKNHIAENGSIQDIPESMEVDERPNLSVNGWKAVYGQ
jgi:hypothetical protein